MTKTEKKKKALRSEPRFEDAPPGEFHHALVTAVDDDSFSIEMFLECVRSYGGGFQQWIRDNRDLFEETDADVETWTLVKKKPSDNQRDIFAGIKTLDFITNNDLREARWQLFTDNFTSENLKGKASTKVESDVKLRKKFVNSCQAAEKAAEDLKEEIKLKDAELELLRANQSKLSSSSSGSSSQELYHHDDYSSCHMVNH